MVPEFASPSLDSVLTNAKTGDTLRYGEVAMDAAAVTLDAEPAFKDPSEWTLLGKGDFGKLNNELIVTGKATYGIDVQIDGMKYAALAQSPVQGGVLKSYDFNAIKDMPGVIQVVEVQATTEVSDNPPILAMNGAMQSVSSAIAVVADHYWQAREAPKVAAEKIGWGKTLPEGEGLGIAIANWSQDLQQDPPFLGSTTATAAHVKVDQDGTLHVLRLEVVPELGTVINYDATEQQIHGGTIFGFNMAMNEELTLDNGALVETNFDKYPMLRMADMPEINVHFDALTGDPRYSEAGEVPVGPVGPAIANAIFAATGKRVREMPFRKADLSWS